MDFTVLPPMIISLLLLQSHADQYSPTPVISAAPSPTPPTPPAEAGPTTQSGKLQVVGPSHPIVALVGGDIILPCRLEPASDASGMTLQWMRPELSTEFVFMRKDGRDVDANKHPSYRGRTSVSSERLKLGDLSLNISNVNVSDHGTYRCFVPSLSSAVLIDLVVGAVSSPVISKMDVDSSGVVLQCESKGWHPEPEVLWLDSEGHVFSGPTETVRGPDGLYDVSSRVTVKTRRSINVICRVQQKKIKQIRETQIYISVQPRHWKWILILVVVSIVLCVGLTVVCRNRKRR